MVFLKLWFNGCWLGLGGPTDHPVKSSHQADMQLPRKHRFSAALARSERRFPEILSPLLLLGFMTNIAVLPIQALRPMSPQTFQGIANRIELQDCSG